MAINILLDMQQLFLNQQRSVSEGRYKNIFFPIFFFLYFNPSYDDIKLFEISKVLATLILKSEKKVI